MKELTESQSDLYLKILDSVKNSGSNEIHPTQKGNKRVLAIGNVNFQAGKGNLIVVNSDRVIPFNIVTFHSLYKLKLLFIDREIKSENMESKRIYKLVLPE